MGCHHPATEFAPAYDSARECKVCGAIIRYTAGGSE
jgi:ribosomal protein S27E